MRHYIHIAIGVMVVFFFCVVTINAQSDSLNHGAHSKEASKIQSAKESTAQKTTPLANHQNFSILSFFKEIDGGKASAIVALIIPFLMIALQSFKKWWRKPVLAINETDLLVAPYGTEIASEPILNNADFGGQQYKIYSPVKNFRIMIENRGRSTAKNVIVRLEQIILYDVVGKEEKRIYYHPTQVKWSGELGWNSVDIVQGSHFFLDAFKIISNNRKDIIDCNANFYGKVLPIGFINTIVDNIDHIGTVTSIVYWNVWVDNPFIRGIPPMYKHDGIFKIVFVMNSENANSLHFALKVDLDKDDWKNPKIEIEYRKPREDR
ncbi:hypothetical protein [Desulfatibacillum aliphaticivorans]|uniref:hypothetical protein n=1 Tax=Desulfatibacillum aliphaticivorans TaxID=218208 RepID=UPI000420D996|nr:hypothetical protein [Desulfatibacillum aliphaticivorans]